MWLALSSARNGFGSLQDPLPHGHYGASLRINLSGHLGQVVYMQVTREWNLMAWPYGKHNVGYGGSQKDAHQYP